MKATKYATHKFTEQELQAQRVWRRADGDRSKIVEALKSCDFFMTRDAMHARLDRRLDAIDRQRNKARELFPDVEESFTVATMEITL